MPKYEQLVIRVNPRESVAPFLVTPEVPKSAVRYN